MKTMIRLFKGQDGATAIEYALIAALISVVVIAALSTIGTEANKAYSKVGSSITSANR